MEFSLQKWLPTARMLGAQLAAKDEEADLLASELRKRMRVKGHTMLVCLRRGTETQFLFQGASQTNLETEINILLSLGWTLDPQVFVEVKAKRKRLLEEWI